MKIFLTEPISVNFLICSLVSPSAASNKSANWVANENGDDTKFESTFFADSKNKFAITCGPNLFEIVEKMAMAGLKAGPQPSSALGTETPRRPPRPRSDFGSFLKAKTGKTRLNNFILIFYRIFNLIWLLSNNFETRMSEKSVFKIKKKSNFFLIFEIENLKNFLASAAIIYPVPG